MFKPSYVSHPSVVSNQRLPSLLLPSQPKTYYSLSRSHRGGKLDPDAANGTTLAFRGYFVQVVDSISVSLIYG